MEHKNHAIYFFTMYKFLLTMRVDHNGKNTVSHVLMFVGLTKSLLLLCFHIGALGYPAVEVFRNFKW